MRTAAMDGMARLRLAATATAIAAGIMMGATSVRAQDLTIGVRAVAEGLDPHFSGLGSHLSAVRNIYDSLADVGPSMELIPGLAESWRTVDPTTWELKLRRGVKFHDGGDFTARDVKFSFDRIPTVGAGTGGVVAFARRVSAVEIVDDYTVRLKTASPAPGLMLDLARVFIASEKASKDASQSDFNAAKAAIGTGPYKAVSFAARNEMILERFDGYWGAEKAPWRRVSLIEISNDSARVAALLSKRVDMINYAPPSDVARLKREAGIGITQAPSLFNFILWPDVRPRTPTVTNNAGQPIDNPFRDVKVRQAMSLAIDRNLIARQTMEGTATPVHQLVPSSVFGFNRQLPAIPFDVERARKLLAEAGFPEGFRVQLHCTNDRLPNDARVCAALGQMLARIGIKADIQAVSRTVFFPAQGRGEYSLQMQGWGTVTGEAGYTLAAQVHTRDADKRTGTFNWTFWSDPALDAQIAAATSELDDTKRQQLLAGAVASVAEKLPVIPVVNLQAIWAGRSERVRYEARADEDTLAIKAKPGPAVR
jgi:peptide/nickel transport system substrate-binding protein